MRHKRFKSYAAFTLVEVLLSLMIVSFMLAAVAVAFDASLQNYQANDAMNRNINLARQALLRMTNDVRAAKAVALVGTAGNSQYLNDANNQSGSDDPDVFQLSLITSDNKDITYRWDSDQKTLLLQTNYDPNDSDYVLCRNVAAVSFNRDTVIENGQQKVRAVRMVLTVSDPKTGQTQKAVAAAVVRRNVQ